MSVRAFRAVRNSHISHDAEAEKSETGANGTSHRRAAVGLAGRRIDERRAGYEVAIFTSLRTPLKVAWVV